MSGLEVRVRVILIMTPALLSQGLMELQCGFSCGEMF
jgi:hypothetical protein